MGGMAPSRCPPSTGLRSSAEMGFRVVVLAVARGRGTPGEGRTLVRSIRAAGLCFVLALVCGAPAQTLHVYGPGGPVEPMRACAALFTSEAKIPVVVTGGPEKTWWPAAQGDADLVYGGAEYMLTQFDRDHPAFLEPGSRTELYARAAGILVRPGNPKRIHSLADLVKPGVHLLDVNGAGQMGLWEDMAGKAGLIGGLQANIALSVGNSAEAVQQWSARPDLDAWITFESWHYRMPKTTELVSLPEAERVYRGTPIAVVERSSQKAQAKAFLRELQSPECHAVFQRWGWR